MMQYRVSVTVTTTATHSTFLYVWACCFLKFTESTQGHRQWNTINTSEKFWHTQNNYIWVRALLSCATPNTPPSYEWEDG